MSKKDKMLNYISDNVKWFLSTDSSIEVIPYHKMSNAVFARAKQYLVSGDVKFEDVVCLVSTSILESGKSGILFTTDAMYCKSWGGLLTTNIIIIMLTMNLLNLIFIMSSMKIE